MERLKVLVADDETMIRETCTRVLQKMGFSTFAASTSDRAIELAREHDIGFAVLDIRMPGRDGIETLRELKKLQPDMRAIMITGFGSVDSAVRAIRLGASDYLMKPFSITDLEEAARRAFGHPLERSEAARGEEQFCGLVGKTPVMLELRRMIELVSWSDVTALIGGETGTGKELVARAIHKLSPRSAEPFIPIDCSVIGERIAESELFGHKKGSFTDAHADRLGLLQTAGKGTVFLDEITNIPIDVQAKLLRTLQEKEIRPIGSEAAHKFEARILAASNADISRAVSSGRFREDLFYRLHVVPINVPPLRDRREDIPALVKHFAEKHATPGKKPIRFENPAVRVLMSLRWPGNVRELESLVRMVITVAPGPVVTRTRLESLVGKFGSSVNLKEVGVHSLDEAERDTIVKALAHAGGDKRKAAKMLGLALSSLYRKLKKFGIEN